MECIYCGHKTTVGNSRPQKRLQQVWRRRSCASCGAVFTTIEAVELAGSLVVRSKSGHLEAFSRDKLYLSIWRTLGHRNDAVSAASALTATSIAILRNTSPGPRLERVDLISTTAGVLKRFDTAAAVQYSAYHKLT